MHRPAGSWPTSPSCGATTSSRSNGARCSWREASSSSDALLVTEGHYLVGVSAFWRGAFESSRVHLQRSLDAYDPEREAQHLELFGQDPVSVCLVRLAFTLWVLGHIDEADAAPPAGIRPGRRPAAPVHAGLRPDPRSVERCRSRAGRGGGAAHGRAPHAMAGTRGSRPWRCPSSPDGPLCGRGDAGGRDTAAGGGRQHSTLDRVPRCSSPSRSCSSLGPMTRRAIRLRASGWQQWHGTSPSGRCSSTKPRATASRASCCTAPAAIPAEVEALLRHAVETARRQGAPALEDKARVSLVRWLATADPRRASVEQRHWDELRQRFPALGRTEDSGSAPVISRNP